MSQTETPRKRSRFRMKPGTIVSLAATLIVLIGLLIYYRPPAPLQPSIDRATASVIQAAAVNTVLPFDSTDLVEVEMTRDDAHIHLTRIDGDWHIVDPFTDLADPEVVGALVESLAGMATDEELELEEALSEYGLDNPVITATFVDREGQRVEFALGQPEGVVEWYVHTSASDSIFLVRNVPARPFNILPGDMISGQLMDFEVRNVARIISQIGGETEVIEQIDGRWYSETPLGRALVFGVSEFLRDLRFVNASNIVATADTSPWEELGLAPVGQTMQIGLELNDGTTLTLDVGHTTPDGRRYYVRSSGRDHAYIVVEFVSNNLLRKLQLASTDMLTLNTARVNGLQVTSVDASGTASERTFSRNAQGVWTSNRRVAFNIGELLNSVVGVAAFGAAPEADAATFGFHPAAGSMRVQFTMENRAVYVFEVGGSTPDGQYIYVRTNSLPGVYLASPEASQRILEGLASVRSDLLPFQTAEVTRIEVANVPAGGGDHVTHEIVRTNGAWQRAGAQVDTAQVESLLNLLRGMQAESIPPVVSEEEYGFYPAARSTRVTVHLGDDMSYVLDIGASK